MEQLELVWQFPWTNGILFLSRKCLTTWLPAIR